jgi:hypothetical protein
MSDDKDRAGDVYETLTDADGQTVRVKPRRLWITFPPAGHEPEQEQEDRFERIKAGRFGGE